MLILVTAMQVIFFTSSIFHASVRSVATMPRWLDTLHFKPSDSLRLGTWQLHTTPQSRLIQVAQALHDLLTLKQRYIYIRAAKKLAEPLLKDYHRLIININIKTPTTPLIRPLRTIPPAAHLPNAPCMSPITCRQAQARTTLKP